MTNLSSLSNNTSWAKKNYYLSSWKSSLLFYSETMAATITLHLTPQEYPHVSQKSSLCSLTNLSYISVRQFHRNCRWWTQAILCNSIQGRRQPFYTILHHLLAWERAALNTHSYSNFPGQATVSAVFYLCVLSWWLQLLLYIRFQRIKYSF